MLEETDMKYVMTKKKDIWGSFFRLGVLKPQAKWYRDAIFASFFLYLGEETSSSK